MEWEEREREKWILRRQKTELKLKRVLFREIDVNERGERSSRKEEGVRHRHIEERVRERERESR